MAPLFVLWSFLFLFLFNELQASWNQNSWRDNHTFYYYANEQKPSVTVSTGPVHPSILQGAYDCYEQSYHESKRQEYLQAVISGNELLNRTIQSKTNQIHAEIQTIQQTLNTWIDSQRHRPQELESLLDFFTISVSEPELQQLLYDTQKQLAKYLVDKQEVIHWPSSDQLKKIKKIRKKFYQQLKEYQKKSDSRITTHLMNAISSGSFDNFLTHKGTSFAVKFSNNQTNADFYRVLQFSRNHDFDKAAPIVARYKQKVNKISLNATKERERAQSIANEMSQLYNHYFYQIYDKYGIEKQFDHDSEYAAHHYQQVFPPIPNHEYNTYLASRAQDKMRIEESISHLYEIEDTCITIQADTRTARMHALERFKKEGDARTTSAVILSTEAKNFLREFDIHPAHLEMMQANALQKQMQNEFVVITERTSQQHIAYRNYTQQATLVNARLIDIGVAYTRENNIAQAHIISDCCTKILNDVDQWIETLPYAIKRALIYSKAIACGIGDGVINSAEYMIEHPIEAALTATLPEIMVPYHVIKITCSALRITYDRLSRIDYKTITSDSIKAQFDELYESVCNIDGPELVRQTVALSTQILIDGKAAHACNAASKQALSFLAKEVKHIKKARSLAPQFALAGDARMPNILRHASEEEPLLQQCSRESSIFNKTKNSEEILHGKLNPINKIQQFEQEIDCPASCNINYENLKADLKIKEFTSIIDVTEHGIQRLLERNISAKDLLDALTKPDFLKTQSDNLKVYIKKNSNNKYNIFIVNPVNKKLVTTMSGLDEKALKGLERNYGWTI